MTDGQHHTGGRDLVLRGGHVIPVEGGAGELPATDVRVAAGRIAAIGPGLDTTGSDVLDVRGQAVLPGFVDTHRHIWQAPLRGVGADMSLRRYLSDILGGVAPRVRPADLRLAAVLGAAEALDAGVTTVFDWCNATLSPAHAEAALDGLAAAGIRAVFGHGNPDDPGDVGRLAPRTGLVTTALSLVGPEYLPFDVAARHIALARDLGLRASMHVGGGTHGPAGRAVSRLHEASLLGADLHFAHCATIGDDEVRMLVDSGAGVTVTPVVEAMMGHGTPAYGRFVAAGGAPALGVDVVVATGPDMFAPMRAALWQERARSNQAALDAGRDPTDVRPAAADLLRAATADGAAALGMADIGTIAVGRRADLVVLDGVGHLTGGAAAGAGSVAGAVVASLGPG
ncbi:MAG TPA: amidohydrolase family protein, partial [Pilimelia sp.]|nr:amidohydrolase family protein [Pilimelia sp.]